jgi:hypothetical protein
VCRFASTANAAARAGEGEEWEGGRECLGWGRGRWEFTVQAQFFLSGLKGLKGF